MNDLKVTIIQSDLHWEDKDQNLKMFSKKIASIPEATDLIVLPEMFTTGFSMKPENFAEAMSGNTISWMKQQAQEKKSVIAGSIICQENGSYFNRLVWMKPDGTYSTYDKRHLFSMGDENNHYTPGNKKIIEEINGWKICPLICYDLRFPVWARNTITKESQSHRLLEYDVLIYVANWPEKRNHPWKTLLMARAIENQCYVIGVNRIGKDINELIHSGDSAVINARGEVLSNVKPHEEGIETVNLNFSKLEEFRISFPAFNDSDNFEIKY